LKLLEKYNRLNVTAIILTFIIGSCTFYFLLNYILIHQLDETLQSEKQEIVTYAATHNMMPEIIKTKDQNTSYEEATDPCNTIIYNTTDPYKKHRRERREIQFTINAGGKYNLVKVSKPLEETEYLLKVIIGVTVAMIAFILITGYLINRIVIRRLWKPFYETISKVNNYHLSDQDTLKLPGTEIDEFSLLNQSVNKMVERIQQDYGSLKNFTGQAAHEIQTPLAIIRSKLDMLMQNEKNLEGNAQHIADIEHSVQRLSRLHQSLLLLTKVENKQFALNEEVSLADIIRDKCLEYAELSEELKLNVNAEIQPVTILFHKHLAEILINNLFGNAIKYNIAGGHIDIILKNRQLMISNTSDNAPLDEQKVFKRFYRNSNNVQEGNGLGLSIVKQIADMAGYRVMYAYTNGLHVFIINF